MDRHQGNTDKKTNEQIEQMIHISLFNENAGKEERIKKSIIRTINKSRDEQLTEDLQRFII